MSYSLLSIRQEVDSCSYKIVRLGLCSSRERLFVLEMMNFLN
jgi:hypothetical protein